MSVPEPAGGRPPAVAGVFYPAESARLAATVDALLAAASRPGPAERPAALVVPHAGHRYSGPVAAAAYALVRGSSAMRAVLLGPAHFVPLAGSAVPSLSAWMTPLGPVPVDGAARDRALTVRGVHADDQPHAREHALEVQLPFLQRSAGPDLAVLPVATAAAADQVADLIDAIAADPRTLVIASTDLSHHLPDADARDRDARTIRAVLDLRPDGIPAGAACGGHALRGLLTWAARTGRAARLLSYRTSADAGGDPHRVVGYAAFAVG